jgi:hypothetical protein
MRGLFVRTRRVLLLAVALAVAAALSAGTTAHAAIAAVPSTPCSFNPVVLCQSSDSTIALKITYTNASACTFAWDVAWGDGSVSEVTDVDPGDGSVLLAHHTYPKAASYTISATGSVTAGDCAAFPFTGHFTLVKPTTPSVTAFAVKGNHPVQPGNDRDTHAQTPKATCNTIKFVADEAIAQAAIGEWLQLGLGASVDLMKHFLSGKGTGVNFDVTSVTAQETSKDGGFQTLNKSVQANVLAQLKKGVAAITIPASVLAPPVLGDNYPDLYYGFRGTQGVTVTGHGTLEKGRYVGDLLYKITDTYGYKSPSAVPDGSQLRYLQTNCGAPYKKGGAHWFQDTIDVVVPFNQPA